MKQIVVDSSVIIKWFKSEKEQKQKEALEYLKDFIHGKIQICVPAITQFELINIAIFDTSLPQERWRLNIKKFYELNLLIISIDKDISLQVYDFGKKHSISAYDAAYVVLAKNKNTDFITADQKLVKKINLPFVKSL